MKVPKSWYLTKYLIDIFTIPYKNLKIDERIKKRGPFKKYEIPKIIDIIN